MSARRFAVSVVVASVMAAAGCSDSKDEGAAGNPGGGGGGGGGDGGALEEGTIPCDVVDVFVDNCKSCHGPTPAGGAVSLTSLAKWQAQSPLYDPDKKIHEVAKTRIELGEMPQGRTMKAADLAVIMPWLEDGAPSGGEDAASCQDKLTDSSTSSMRDGGEPDDGILDECLREGAFDPLVPREGETCYEFVVHGQEGVDDTSKFEIPTGETYHEFYYDVPWEPGTVWTRFGAKFDNLPRLHHYLVFTNNGRNKVAGQIDRNVPGTTLGSESTLIYGWAVGACSTEMPEGVGSELPDSNLIMVQWHMYNTTDEVQLDGSAVQVCTVPASAREHTAGITFLGTENLGGFVGMPPGRNEFTTDCENTTQEDVTIIGFTPHMHTLGINMKTELQRLDGSTTTIFDRPFDFNYQVGYLLERQVTVKPGEKLITTCSFMNDTDGNVGFGQSTEQEMCYQYVAYYPAGALNNGVFSLIGATNTCW